MRFLLHHFRLMSIASVALVLTTNALAADLSQAVALIQRQDYQRAEPLLRQVLDQEADAEAAYLLGFLLIETYRFEEAEGHLRAAVAANPQQAHWLMVLAKSLLEQGKNIAAGEILQQAIAIEARPAYHHAHAMTALNAGDMEAGEASLLACLALDEQHNEALSRLGGLLIDQGRDRDSIEFLEKARSGNPQNLDNLYRLGTAYRHVGRLGEAAEIFAALVEAVPGHVGALHNLSRILMQQGQREQATGVMQQFSRMSELRDEIDFHAFAVRKNPDNIEGRLHLASLYLRAGRTREALGELLAARVMAPRDARIYRSLATAYRRLGDENNAVRAARFADTLEGTANG